MFHEKIILSLVALALTACQNAPEAFKPEPFAFERSAAPAFAINVARITIVEAYQSPMRRPQIEHEFPVTPANAVRTWATTRLKAVGSSGVLEITIGDASVTESKLPKTAGIKGLFTDDQEARYEAKLGVSMRVSGVLQGMSDTTGQVLVTRTRTINEKASVYQRQAMYHQMTDAMMNDFDREASARLRDYFSAFVK